MNVLLLDEERVIAEKQEEQSSEPLKNADSSRSAAISEISIHLADLYHRATPDVSRRGALQSYF